MGTARGLGTGRRLTGLLTAFLVLALVAPHPADAAEPQLVVIGDGIRAEIDRDPWHLRILDGDGRVLLEELGGSDPRWAGLSVSSGFLWSTWVGLFETTINFDLDFLSRGLTRVTSVNEVPGGLRMMVGTHDPLNDRKATVTVTSAAPRRLRVRMELDDSSGVHRLRAAFGVDRDEHWTGFGGKLGPQVDQRGRAFLLGSDRVYQGPELPRLPLPDYKAVPFFLSSKGYGISVLSDGLGTRFDFAKGRADAMSFSVRALSGPLEFDVYAGDPATVLADYTTDTGRPEILPEWAYGTWKSRNKYSSQTELEEDLDAAREAGFPIDIMRVDSPWETTYNTWEPNPEQWEDWDGMLSGIRESGAHPIVWITGWTNVDSTEGDRIEGPQSEEWARNPAAGYEEMADRGLFVENPGGSPYVFGWWQGRGSAVDFTDPEATSFWSSLAVPAIATGIEGLVLDGEEGFYLPDDVRFSDGRSGAQFAWGLERLYTAAMADALHTAHGEETVLLRRAGGRGIQSLGATWPGDQWSSPYGLREVVGNGISSSATGISNWQHDVGGYFGRPPTIAELLTRLILEPDRPLSQIATGFSPTRDTLIRWAQVGAFTPAFQMHSIANVEPWDESVYDAETLEIVRAFARLHEQLVPYIRAMARQANGTGIPILRGLFLEEPENERAWRISDAYLFGDAFWVGPMLDTRAGSRMLYLPAGRWVDFWSGQLVEGGREVTVDAPLDRLPVFARAGSIVPTYPGDVTTVTDGASDPRAVGPDGRLDVRVWPWGGETASTFTTAGGAVFTAEPGTLSWTGAPAASLLVRMPVDAVPASVVTDLGPIAAASSLGEVRESRAGWYHDPVTGDVWAGIPAGARMVTTSS